MPSLRDWVCGIPKAELHLHLEGTLEPEMLLDLSKRNHVSLPYATADACRAAYRFTDLQHFLDVYYTGVAVLCTEGDFFELTAAYLRRAAADGVRHAEVFFDPQSHVSRGIPFADVVAGITRALDQGERQLGISWQLIMCLLRDKPVQSALEMLERAMPYRDVITGVGLDSAELGHPPRDFITAFAHARAAGLRPVVHAGEEGPSAYIWEALDLLGATRIDHGVRAIDDHALMMRLAEERVPLTMCPLSNLHLQVTPDLAAHPLKQLLDAGLCVTVNSDDPAYFGGYLTDNYLAVATALGLTRSALVTLAHNSITASWLPEARQAELLAEIDEYAARTAGEGSTGASA